MPFYLILQSCLVDGNPCEQGEVHEFDEETGRKLTLMGRVSHAAPKGDVAEVAFEDMKKAELLAYAESAGFKVDDSMTKAQIIAAITGQQSGGLTTENAGAVVK